MNNIQHDTTVDIRNRDIDINKTTLVEHTECDIDRKNCIDSTKYRNNENLIDMETEEVQNHKEGTNDET